MSGTCDATEDMYEKGRTGAWNPLVPPVFCNRRNVGLQCVRRRDPGTTVRKPRSDAGPLARGLVKIGAHPDPPNHVAPRTWSFRADCVREGRLSGELGSGDHATRVPRRGTFEGQMPLQLVALPSG